MSLRLSFAFLFLVLSAQADENKVNLRFEELPKLVGERNGTATAARDSLSAARERTGYLKRSFLPNLNLRAGLESAKVGPAGRQTENFWAAEAKVNVFRGGKDSLEEDILQSKVKSGQAQATKDFQTELKHARQLFWNLAATQISVAELKDAIAQNEENIRGAKKRAGAGVATGADGIQFELEKTILNQNLKKMIHEEDIFKAKLAVVTGLEDHKDIRIDLTFPHPPEAEFQERKLAPEQNVDVRILRESESAERLRSRQSGKWYMPKLDVYAKYGIPTLDDDYTRAVNRETELISGVSLTLDLGQVFQDRATGGAQQYEAQALAARAAQRSKAVQAESHELQHDLRMLHELLHDADRDVLKAGEFLKLTKSEYTRGVKNGPDLLEAFSKYYEFRQRKIQLNLEYQLAKAEFEALSVVD